MSEKPEPVIIEVPIGEANLDFQGGNFQNAIDFVCSFYSGHVGMQEKYIASLLRNYADFIDENFEGGE